MNAERSTYHTPAGPVFTDGSDRFRLAPGTLNITRARIAAARHLAATLGIAPSAVDVEDLRDADGTLTGFSLVVSEQHAGAYGRVTYDEQRCWSYCGDPNRPAGDPDCSFILPYAPPLEAVTGGAEHIIYRARQLAERTATAGQAVSA